MKPNSRIIFSFVSIIFVLSIIISPVTSAQEQKQEEKQQVDELTEELEYYFKDAEIHNDEGEIVDYNYDIIKSKFPKEKQKQLEKIEEDQDSEVTNEACPSAEACKNASNNTECIVNSVNWLDAIGATAAGEVIQALNAGNYAAASGSLIKLGVKGGAAGIAGNLSWTAGKCMAQGNPKGGV
ncbi:hypothetical protein [Staphylococcus nepalensis]|uniref:hypothetical protein n=1 Tax=Staphylococcus nepalensis TaxID=214473 RepID=UPI003EE6D468